MGRPRHRSRCQHLTTPPTAPERVTAPQEPAITTYNPQDEPHGTPAAGFALAAIPDAVLGILDRIDRLQRREATTGRRWIEAIGRAQTGRTTCAGCGCLCLPDEPCPGCRARARQEPT